MKWFYNLKRVVRVIIAVVSWLPLFIFAGVIGGSVGENGENMQTWQALIICALLAVGVVFTVFAIKARAKETKADRDAKRAENASRKKITASNPIDSERAEIERQLAENKAYQAQLREKMHAMEQADPTIRERAARGNTVDDTVITARIVSGVDFPIFTKAVGVTFDDCQTNIQESNIGDPLLIKHKPTEEYPESTDIVNARTHKRVGRLKSDLAWEFLGEFDERFTLDGEIADITGGNDGQNYGCNIKIIGEHYDE